MSGPPGTARNPPVAGRADAAVDGSGAAAPACAPGPAAGLAGPGDRTVLVADDGAVALSARSAATGAVATPDARAAFLRLLVTAPGLAGAVCAVVLAPDGLRTCLPDGRAVPEALRALGVLPGVGAGTCAADRVADWAACGAAFARCRIAVTGGTRQGPRVPPAAAREAASFARACQDAGVLPLVEVDVDGTGPDHPAVTGLAGALAAVLDAVSDAGADPGALALGAGLVGARGAGRGCPHPDAARRTVEALRSSVPAGVAGVALLPGRSAATHTVACRAALRRFPTPWPVAVVGDPAALGPALRTWRGSEERRAAAQAVLAGELAWDVAALRYGIARPGPAVVGR